MQNQSYQDRMKSIYQMLFEMATGNLSFRIDAKEGNDEIDQLADTLIMLAVAMQNTAAESGYVTPYYSYQSLIQNTLLLDQNYNIKSFNAKLLAVLEYKSETLSKMGMDKIIAPQSIAIWENIKHEIQQDENFHTTVQLIFTTANNQFVPAFCTVSKLINSNDILVSSVTTVLQNTFSDIVFLATAKAKPRKNNATIIQNLYEYILNHLEEPLPTTKKLSKMLGTNEFKLKKGFRQSFHTGIYQFYNNERLKRAQLLIQQTLIPLKEIAFMCGFNDYVNFSKAFKKKFKYPPSDLKRSPED